MSSAAAAARPAVNPWLIAILVALASFMEVLDTTIANVALNYISGGLGVSADEASWVVLDELNTFAWPGYDLRPIPGSPGRYAYGMLPPRFFTQIIERLRSLRAKRRVRTTER